MPEQTTFDLNDPRLMSTVEYRIVVFAEYDFGLGPSSNDITYTRVEEGNDCLVATKKMKL